jgi:sulfite exporter TauE/SafE
MEFFAAAFSLGLFGSFHCAGMCGPIVLALPIGRFNKFQRLAAAFIYHAGRATTYGIFGGLIGFLGSGISWIGSQQFFSITIGLIILIFVLLPDRVKLKVEQSLSAFVLLSWVKPTLASLFQEKSFSSLYFIGALNGLLPCGLIYTAFAGAFATGHPLKGSIFMMLFAMGTLPMMMFVNLSGSWINSHWRSRFRKAVPALVSAMAILLIIRGLNLGIPYLSPKAVELGYDTTVICH